jgi:chromosome segregation ATPase
MEAPQFVVDRECVASSFREWQEEQLRLDAQLAESVAALDAYQSNLDNWQQELVREREELRQLRADLQRAQAARGGDSQQLAALTTELESSRGEVARLQSDLAAAQSREQELNDALTAQQQPAENRDTQSHDALDAAIEDAATSTGQVGTAKGGNGGVEPRRGVSPVLGSVMEQFGKLRQQRSLNRSTNKTR